MKINTEYRGFKKSNNIPTFRLTTPHSLSNAMVVFTSIILAGIMLFIVGECDKAFPADLPGIPVETAVRCIIGEAGNQGNQGMLALAEALRNRGTTKGVYGCKAKHIDNEPEWVFEKARQAWIKSASSNLTKGANHWENIKAFGEPYWAKSMVKTYEYRDHVFYKEAK